MATSPASTVLLTGESGTGKDLAAKVLHYASARANKPFVNITCSALPENLLESELFGHERGAFTDARQQKRGLLESADGGTVFLDEIGEMPARAAGQAAALPRGEGACAASAAPQTSASTCGSSPRPIARSRTRSSAGRFREDLFYRLNVLPLKLPPLRAHIDDLPALVAFYVDIFNREFKKNVRGASDATLRLLASYGWPGNVRELRNAVERAMLLARATAGAEQFPLAAVRDLDACGRAAGAGPRPRGGRAQSGAAGARAHGLEPDARGETARTQPRPDPLPHREVQAELESHSRLSFSIARRAWHETCRIAMPCTRISGPLCWPRVPDAESLVSPAGYPKQFWSVGDRRTLLEDTLARVAPLSSPDRTVIVVDRQHKPFVEDLPALNRFEHILYQPRDRGTAAGVLLALIEVVAMAPDAIVLLTPSDHGFNRPELFQSGIRLGVEAVDENPNEVVLYGVRPTAAEGDYGWITPDRANPGARLRRVSSFVEKPAPSVARRLLESGAVWNTMVLVARVGTLMALYRQHLPDLEAVFWHTQHLKRHDRAADIHERYEIMPAADFSHDLLGVAAGLSVHTWPAAIGWTDLGTPDRLERWCGTSRWHRRPEAHGRGSSPSLRSA